MPSTAEESLLPLLLCGRWRAARLRDAEAALEGASTSDLGALAAALRAARAAGLEEALADDHDREDEELELDAQHAEFISGVAEGALAQALAPLFVAASRKGRGRGAAAAATRLRRGVSFFSSVPLLRRSSPPAPPPADAAGRRGLPLVARPRPCNGPRGAPIEKGPREAAGLG